MTVSGIKSVNSGTWSGNSIVKNGVTFAILTDDGENVVGIKINGTASANANFYLFGVYGSTTALIASGEYKATLTGITADTELHSGYGSDGFNTVTNSNPESTLNALNGVSYCIVRVKNGASISTAITVKPMIRLSTESDATFAPYSNICPISGRASTSVSTTDGEDTESVSIAFGTTVYGGNVNFKTGVVTVTHGYIASYNGETLPGEWISDRDVYASGTTPTTGAQVAYELATPTTLTLTPDELTMIKGDNSVTGDGVITITALTGDSWS